MTFFYTFTASFLFWLLTTLNILVQAVEVDIDIKPQFFGSAPIEGTVIVSHSKEEKVDPESFKLGTETFKVELIKEEPMTASGDLILSLYHFKLPPRLKGPHIFREVTVDVGGTKYQSVPRTFEVKDAPASTPSAPAKYDTPTEQPPSQQPASSQTASIPPFLQLKTYVGGPEELYPGQQIIIGYRYFYTGNIDTTQEVIPLLEAEGFTKIGDKVITERELNGLSVRQITQKIEAKQPGEYTFGPSLLEGYAYESDLGRKVYAKEKLSSSAAAVVLRVSPFPEDGKPPSFNGAIGKFVWTVKLISPTTVHTGDEVELSIDVKGDGNLDSVKLPELCCQPGMSGLFSLSDLPPVGELKGDTKHFDVKLRPLSTSIKALPKLEFSYFDPETKKYVIFHSDPIPLSVVPLDTSKPSVKNLPIPDTTPAEETQQKQALATNSSVEAINTESSYPLQEKDLHNLPFGTWWSLLILPFGCAALLYQYNLFKYLEAIKSKPKIIDSEDLFSQAQAAPLGSAEAHELLCQAFLHRLAETGEINSPEINPEALPTTGIIGEVRTLLLALEETRYAGRETRDKEETLMKNARHLFEKLKIDGGVS
ncbi:MAG: BatD family protein [Parachlamydiaceae bacterium]|nr:BatD family protein [Parachlamydiaceae bacterium]